MVWPQECKGKKLGPHCASCGLALRMQGVNVRTWVQCMKGLMVNHIVTLNEVGNLATY